MGRMGEVLRGDQHEAIRSLRDKIKDNEQKERATTIISTKNKHKEQQQQQHRTRSITMNKTKTQRTRTIIENT